MAVVGVEALWQPYRLTIPIEEGTQYHYGTFDLEGAKALAAEPATTDLRYHSWRSRQLHHPESVERGAKEDLLPTGLPGHGTDSRDEPRSREL